jgi:hypothetical protein
MTAPDRAHAALADHLDQAIATVDQLMPIVWRNPTHDRLR